jgi:NosR/NirI family nitrous oxide reductase transcriptional regulator
MANRMSSPALGSPGRQLARFRSALETSKLRRAWPLLLLILAYASTALVAQYQRQPPDFGGTYTFPTPTHPEPRTALARGVDVAMLVVGLGFGAYLIHKRRSRNAVVLLSIGAIAYFGFYRRGCICPIGSIQNVTAALVDPRYLISFGVLAFFFLPLVMALLFGRVYCGAICPHGAVQDLVLLKPQKVPHKLDRVLRWLPYVYLAVAVLFAGWGLPIIAEGGKALVGRRFLICEWDPFIGLFRISGSFHMLALGAGFIVLGMFYGRPYCRWLCPYGALLSLCSRVAWKNVRITPDKELACGLCAESCPYDAIHDFQADRALCVACTRCYDSCPRHVKVHRRGQPVAVTLYRQKPPGTGVS